MPRPFRLPWQTKEEHERDVAIWEHHMDEYASGLEDATDRDPAEDTEEEDYGDPEGGTQEDSDD